MKHRPEIIQHHWDMDTPARVMVETDNVLMFLVGSQVFYAYDMGDDYYQTESILNIPQPFLDELDGVISQFTFREKVRIQQEFDF